MDRRAQSKSTLFSNLTRAFKLLPTLMLIACTPDQKSEAILPDPKETCGGAAIQSKYIVRYKSGRWDYIQNHDRENFKTSYVEPNSELIDFIEYDQKINLFEYDPHLVTSGIDNWGIDNINASSAWQRNFKGKGVVVAVIDTGVDIQHPQLRSQIDFHEGEAGDLSHNGVDDDGNGYIDDYAGYNFSADVPNSNVSDDVGHGTHVAGIIAAAHSDTSLQAGYTQGVAPEAKILPVKFLGEDGGTLSSALQGIDYAIARGAKIINASWGGPGCSTSLRKKISDASDKNILFIVAAGNSGNNIELSPEYPAAFNLPYQITVGAIRSSLFMDSYSNYSQKLVHLFAPGTKIVSTIPNNGYAAFSGTSMATPFVAGASAVLIGANPNLNPNSVRSYLFKSSTQNFNYSNLTQGRLNLGAAVDAAGL